MPSQINKRIAKNTLFLYVRMAFTLVVSLYTSRIVLKYLGFSDFGIFEVVNGITISFSFLTASMMLATQRYLNFTLGQNDNEKVSKVFSTALNIHLIISAGLLILSETAGLYFLNHYLNIPAERITAANVVYQFAVGTMLLGIIAIPYNALIIAHEKMSFIAGISIFNALLRLVIVYLLIIVNTDKLIIYAILAFGVTIIIQSSYALYCWSKFKEHSKYHFEYNPSLFKEMATFSGWCAFGGVTSICKSQGINFILNIFYGVTLNAAMGIANRVADAINQFVANFQTAANPQIIMQYAAGETESLSKLINRVSKFSYCLILLLVLPIFFNTDFILHLWLFQVPPYSTDFIQLLLIFILLDSLAGPQWMSILASGKIRNYYIIESLITLTIIPLSIILLQMGYDATITLLCKIAVNIVVLVWRALYMAKNVGISAFSYFKNAILPIFIITPIAITPPLFAKHLLPQGWAGFISSATIAVISVATTTWFLGLNRNEKKSLKEIILRKISG